MRGRVDMMPHMRDAATERRVLEAYDSVLDVAPSERLAFIRRTYSGDPALASELERLASAESVWDSGSFAQGARAVARPIIADLDIEERREAAAAKDSWTARYAAVRTLGRGGTARTILARDEVTGRLVCVKELAQDTDVRMLKQEFRALSRLSHPNIARVIEMSPHSRLPYMLVEYVEGPDLAAYARANLTVRDERSVAALMLPLFDAIACFHANQIIHRDLKPENIMVETRGESASPIVIDFGIAVVDRFDHDMAITAAGPIVRGTPPYMAPEQLGGAILTPACDCYALGVIMYELATGERAFPGSMMQVLGKKAGLSTGLKIPDSFFGRRWPVLGKLVRACTEPDRSRRPTAAAVANTLRTIR